MQEEVSIASEADFDEKVLHSELPIVLNFYADWCGPCHQVEPLLRSLSKELEGKVQFARVDIDKCENIAESYGVHSIPTFIFMTKGHELGRQIGLLAEADFRGILKKYLSQE